VDYVDELVVESLYEIIDFNLNYLLKESDPTLNKRPLFEVKLVLDVSSPLPDPRSTYVSISIWICISIQRWSSAVPRVFTTSSIP
jgi:hypothetical protein